MEWFLANRPDLTRNVASMEDSRRGRAPPPLHRGSRISCAASSPRCSTSASSSRPTASAPCRASTRTIPTRSSSTARNHVVDYEPGGVDQRAVRRELELARAGVVPGQLPADRIAAEVSLLFRRRLQGGVPDGLRPDDEPVGGRHRAVAAAVVHLPAARRPPGGVRRHRAVPDRPALARPGALPRVLPRRHRARAWAPAIRRAGPAVVAKLLQQSGEKPQKEQP